MKKKRLFAILVSSILFIVLVGIWNSNSALQHQESEMNQGVVQITKDEFTQAYAQVYNLSQVQAAELLEQINKENSYLSDESYHLHYVKIPNKKRIGNGIEIVGSLLAEVVVDMEKNENVAFGESVYSSISLTGDADLYSENINYSLRKESEDLIYMDVLGEIVLETKNNNLDNNAKFSEIGKSQYGKRKYKYLLDETFAYTTSEFLE
ncbi:hypothetical protein ABXS75_19550 [Roseburia hominis]